MKKVFRQPESISDFFKVLLFLVVANERNTNNIDDKLNIERVFNTWYK